ncbi:MAG: peptide/nickel transport system permease protein [Candidatus Poriferisodalaceae bacterium]|jgi:peptide/nickel transport system permease protein
MTVETSTEVTQPDTPPPSDTAKFQKIDWLWADTRAKVAFGWVLLMLFVAIFAPLIAPADPLEQNLQNVLVGPSRDFLLGTDDIGRDFFSRMLYGARVSLFGAFLATTVSMVLGIPVGLIAGYVGGIVETVLMRIVDSILGFPGIVLAIGLVAALGPGLTNAMVAIGVTFSPSVARLMRGQVLATKNHLYVDAAEQYGSPTWRTVLRHILPNAIQPIIVQGALLLAVSFLAEAALSFLGLGAQPPTASWGGMLSRSSQFLHVSPSIQLYAPGLAIALTVLAINALGDSLRDSLDPVAGTERRLRRTLARSDKRLKSNNDTTDIAAAGQVT